MNRALLLSGLLVALLLPAAAPAVSPLNLPATEPLLFTLQAESGAFTPAEQKGRYDLTLRGLASQSLWFTDRPARETGAVPTRDLLAGWSRLGFTSDPPNAVVSITGGRASADTVALELGPPRYDRRTRTVRFRVRGLDWLSHDLAHMGPRVDRALPRRFGRAALFIDDATLGGTSGVGCDVIGEADLFAGTNLPAAYVAPGQTLSTPRYAALRSITDGQWGADDPVTFNLPALTAPAGMHWGVCSFGQFPTDPSFGDTDPGCTPGEISLQLVDHPISGWSATSIPAASAGTWMTCVKSRGAAPCVVSQVAQFTSPAPPANWLPADGRLLSITANMTNMELFSLIGTTYGGDGMSTFATPNLPVTQPGGSWGICATGTYPTPAA